MEQVTNDQLLRRLVDMRDRCVWGRLVLHIQDGVIVRLTREESERADDRGEHYMGRLRKEEETWGS